MSDEQQAEEQPIYTEKQYQEQLARSMVKWRKGLQAKASRADELEANLAKYRERFGDLDAQPTDPNNPVVAEGANDSDELDEPPEDLDKTRREIEEEKERLQREKEELRLEKKVMAMHTILLPRCVDPAVGIKLYIDRVTEDGNGGYLFDGKPLAVLAEEIPDYLKRPTQQHGGSGIMTGTPKMRNTETEHAKKEYERLRAIALKQPSMQNVLESEKARKRFVLLRDNRI